MTKSHATRSPRLPALAALTSALLAASAQATIIEHGVNTAGTSGAVALAYGDHTLNAQLASPLEVDRYTFAGHAGDTVRIQGSTFTHDLDLSLVLRGPTGTMLGSSACNAFWNGTCSTELTRTLPVTGTYTINMADVGVDNGGLYQFHIDEYPPTSRLTPLQFGSAGTINTALQHTTDVDSFSFTAGAGSGIRIAVGTGSNDVDPRMQLWGPDGSLVRSAGCDAFWNGTCTTVIDLDVTSTGVYKLSISDGGWDNAGNYGVSLSCTYGVCPPPPVPEPQTYALLAGGLGMLSLALHRRRRQDH